MKHSNGNGGNARKSKPAAENLQKLYTEDLKDIYWAEKHILKALPKLVKAADSEDLKAGFEHHLSQTEEQVARLEQVFSISGLKVAAKKCDGMEGLLKEGEEVIEDFEPGTVRDAGLIIAAQKVEHYEIAAYGSLRNLARALGLDKAADLLQVTLDEESETDKVLTILSDTINQQAFEESESEKEPAMAED